MCGVGVTAVSLAAQAVVSGSTMALRLGVPVGLGGRAAGDGRRLDARGREERGEDLGADEAGAVDDGGGGEGGRHCGGVLAELYTRIAVV